jgi:hypothetical protein
VSLDLYWARNDGIGGHVWLSPQHVRELAREMDAQGMSRALALSALAPGTRIAPGTVDAALARAASEPIALNDGKLWSDWLAFLEGAVANGGLVVR